MDNFLSLFSPSLISAQSSRNKDIDLLCSLFSIHINLAVQTNLSQREINCEYQSDVLRTYKSNKNIKLTSFGKKMNRALLEKKVEVFNYHVSSTWIRIRCPVTSTNVEIDCTHVVHFLFTVAQLCVIENLRRNCAQLYHSGQTTPECDLMWSSFSAMRHICA